MKPASDDSHADADPVTEALQQATDPAPAARPRMPAPTADARARDRAANMSEERFDVNATNTPAGEFFMGLVDGTDHNIVVHPDVTGTISLTLKNVTVDEVLDVVSDVYGYAYRKSDAGYVVLPASVQSRIFQIDYLNLQRSGTSQTRVSSGQVTETQRNGNRNGAFNGVGNSGFDGGYVGNAGQDGGRSQQVSGSRIETTYKANFWHELETTLQSIVGNTDGHKVVVNAQTGVIVVSAMPDKLRDVEDYLQRSSQSPNARSFWRQKLSKCS